MVIRFMKPRFSDHLNYLDRILANRKVMLFNSINRLKKPLYQRTSTTFENKHTSTKITNKK